jgi:glyoxylase-like metal-dependent hydrolase (beta-lactamase superfamily II)
MNRYVKLAAGLAFFFSGAVALAQPAPVVKQGTTVKVSEHVYVIPDDKVGMVPNVGIVVGSKATLVIDPGMGRPSGEHVLAEVKKVAKGGELIIVNTHFHPEHTTGDVAFPAGARLIRAAAQQQDVDEMGMKWVEIFAKRSAVIADVLKGAEFRKPDEIFEKEKTVDLGGVRVRILRLGPGHTRGDTVMFVEGDGVLFSGDLAMKGLYPAFATPQSSGRTWLTSLDEMDKFKAKTVVGAHYPIADGSVVNDYRGYLKALQARVAALKKQGKSADETAATVKDEFAKKYASWDQPARIEGAAKMLYAEAE